MYIYKITNQITKQMYIGQKASQKCGKKWVDATPENSKKYFGSGTISSRAIKKHGKENFIKEILIDNIDNLDALDLFETYFQNRNPECFVENGGYNIYHGAYRRGGSHSEVTKQKISVANKGRKHSLETKYKLSIAAKGKKHSDEHNKNVRLALRGKKRSQESKNNISKAMKGVKHTKEQNEKVSNSIKGMLYVYKCDIDAIKKQITQDRFQYIEEDE